MTLIFENESYKIRAAIFEVYKILGCGHKEIVYQRALEQALLKQGLKVEREKRLPVLFDGKVVGTYVPDFVINEEIILESKAKPFILSNDEDQFWHYLTATKYTLGFLVNFGKPGGVEIVRKVYDTARQKVPRPSAISSASFRDSSGFTLMEIMVATVIFAVVAVALLSLFNYVLKINRRGEALRQATQDSRDFVEFLVKEIRNGQIDYYVTNSKYNTNYFPASAPCIPPVTSGSTVAVSDKATYQSASNWLGIINTDNVQECFYYAKTDGSTYTYIDTIGSNPSTFSTSTGGSLVLAKVGIASVQKLNPPNARIDNLMFVVRPQKDPYTKPTDGGSLPKIQPVVEIIVKFVVQLPTGEQVSIYYQTAVSENKYDIPNQ